MLAYKLKIYEFVSHEGKNEKNHVSHAFEQVALAWLSEQIFLND